MQLLNCFLDSKWLWQLDYSVLMLEGLKYS